MLTGDNRDAPPGGRPKLGIDEVRSRTVLPEQDKAQ
jgi:cation transport ATPase